MSAPMQHYSARIRALRPAQRRTLRLRPAAHGGPLWLRGWAAHATLPETPRWSAWSLGRAAQEIVVGGR